MILRNREGRADLDIRRDWHAGRRPGLSGLVRLRDEATWCLTAIRSFLPWLDEMIIVVQPSIDGTRDLVAPLAGQQDRCRVRVFDYPVQTHPSGPGHADCPADSIHASAWHYNWTLAQSTLSHAVKLDGDMVMMDWAGAEIRRLMAEGHDRIRFHGTDIVGDALRHIGSHPRCPTDGVFRVRPEVEYRQGPLSQKLHCPDPVTAEIADSAFLHFKWARKGEQSQTKRWPANWRDLPHFRRIWDRQIPAGPYTGEYPAAIREML